MTERCRGMRRIPYRQAWRSMLPLFLLLALAACTNSGSATSVTPANNRLFPTHTLALQAWQMRWLEGIPCAPPCVEGIVPGETRPSDAVDLLKDNPLISDVRVYADSPSEINWKWANSDSSQRAFYQARGTITYIELNFPSSFQLEDVITAYGEPTHILARAGYGLHGLGIVYDLSIIYQNHGFLLRTAGRPPLHFQISGEMSFEPGTSPVFFFPPTEAGLKPLLPPQDIANMLPWQGPKEFAFYCRDDEQGRACKG
jgi:hypothetical protein